MSSCSLLSTPHTTSHLYSYCCHIIFVLHSIEVKACGFCSSKYLLLKELSNQHWTEVSSSWWKSGITFIWSELVGWIVSWNWIATNSGGGNGFSNHRSLFMNLLNMCWSVHIPREPGWLIELGSIMKLSGPKYEGSAKIKLFLRKLRRTNVLWGVHFFIKLNGEKVSFLDCAARKKRINLPFAAAISRKITAPPFNKRKLFPSLIAAAEGKFWECCLAGKGVVTLTFQAATACYHPTSIVIRLSKGLSEA